MVVGGRQRLRRVSGARSPELKSKQTRSAATTSLDRKVSRSFVSPAHDPYSVSSPAKAGDPVNTAFRLGQGNSRGTGSDCQEQNTRDG